MPAMFVVASEVASANQGVITWYLFVTIWLIWKIAKPAFICKWFDHDLIIICHFDSKNDDYLWLFFYCFDYL